MPRRPGSRQGLAQLEKMQGFVWGDRAGEQALWIDGNTLFFDGVLATRNGPVFDVRSFGAMGNGVDDDHAAIQAAVTQAAVTGGTVYLGPGTYRLSATVDLGALPVDVVGAGFNVTVVKLLASANCDMFKAGDGSTVWTNANTGGSLRHLALDGNSAQNSSGNGLRLYGRNSFLVLHCMVRKCAERGIWLDSTGSQGASWGVIAFNHLFDNGLPAIGGNGDGGSYWIIGNMIALNGGSTQPGIGLSGATEAKIESNHLFNNGTHGIALTSCSHIRIRGNVVVGAPRNGIECGGGCAYVIITDNLIDNPGDLNPNTYTGINIADSTRCVVSGNTITATTVATRPMLKGIAESSGADYNLISDNSIEYATTPVAWSGASSAGWSNVGYDSAAKAQFSTTGTVNPGAIAAGTAVDTGIAITGPAVGDDAIASPSGAPEAGLVWSAFATANTITVRLANITGASITPASRTWRVTAFKRS